MSRRFTALALIAAASVPVTAHVSESGITFVHRIVDDAGKTYKAAHDDHGNQLWRNLGGGKFEDITAAAGVAVPGRIGVSASFADIDNDGDPDLYVTTVRDGNILFENDGKGRFRDITTAAGVEYVGHSSSALFFDYDRDGKLDLFLVNVGRYHRNHRGGRL